MDGKMPEWMCGQWGQKRCEGTWTVRKVGGGDNRRRKRDWGGEEVWQKGPREPGP